MHNLGKESALRQVILDTLEVGVCLVRNGRIVWANRAQNRMYGYETGAMSGLPAEALYARPEDFERFAREGCVRLGLGESHSTQAEMRRKNGETFPAEIVERAVPGESEAAPESIWITTDNSQRARHEAPLLENGRPDAALCAENERYRLLVEQMISGIIVCEVICDESGAPRDHRFVSGNPAFEKMTGLIAKEQVGRTSAEMALGWPPDVIQRFHTVALTGEPIAYERFNERLGRMFEARVFSPKRGQFAIVFNDITARREAELQLKESEARFRSVFEGSRDAIVVSRKGIFVFGNPAYLKLFGYAENQELIGLPIGVNIAPSHREELTNNALRRAAGEPAPVSFEARGLRADGTEFDAEYRISTYEMNGEIFSVAHIRDVTAQKAAEEEMRRTSRWLLATQRLSAVGGWSISVGTGAVWLSPEARRIYGVGNAEPTAESLRALALPQHGPMLARAWQDLIEGKSRYDLEFQLARASDGRVIDVHAIAEYEPSEGIVLGAIQDITERRQAEAKLRESEGHLRRAIVDSPFPTMIHAEDGEVVMISDSWVEISGYARSEIATISAWTELAHGPRQHEVRESIRSQYRLSQKCVQRAIPVTTKSGEERIWDFVSTPMGRHSDGRRMVISVAIDVTDRRRAEADLRESEARFRQAQKMEAIGQLAGGVAHDFNNILAAVMLYLGVLKEDRAMDPETRDTLTELERNMGRGVALTRQLLAFSRQQAMDPKVLDLSDLLQGLLKMLRRLLGENIRMTLKAPKHLPSVEADAGMMEQAVINLCVNARDAMPAGGELGLKLEAIEVGEAEAAGSPDRRAGRFVRLSVGDTGCGMTEEVLQHMFEPFFTTKGKGKGTGLGLATVHGIIRQHGGWVEVKSVVGRGTTFWLYLPACPKTVAAADEETKPRPAAGNDETVLIVEDEDALRTAMTTVLRRNGYRVLGAISGREALRQWEDCRDKIDLVISDMVMPGEISGTDLAVRIRSDEPEMKIIIYTGYGPEIDLLRLAAMGIDVLRKPLDIPRLLAVVRQKLDS